MTSAHVYTGKQAHNITDEEQFIQQTHIYIKQTHNKKVNEQ